MKDTLPQRECETESEREREREREREKSTTGFKPTTTGSRGIRSTAVPQISRIQNCNATNIAITSLIIVKRTF